MRLSLGENDLQSPQVNGRVAALEAEVVSEKELRQSAEAETMQEIVTAKELAVAVEAEVRRSLLGENRAVGNERSVRSGEVMISPLAAFQPSSCLILQHPRATPVGKLWSQCV